MAHNSPSPPHTHTYTEPTKVGESESDTARETNPRERETCRARRRGAEATSDSSVVVLNKMFAGAISVNSVVLCLLIQHTPPTGACPCTPYLPTHSQPARGQLFDPHHLQNFM